MVKMYFYTQDYENYGSPDEPYWKAKGGSDFILEAGEWTEEMVAKACELIEHAGEMFIRSIIGNQVVCDEFKTDFEQMQFEHEGYIEYPAVRMTFDNFLKLNSTMKECI